MFGSNTQPEGLSPEWTVKKSMLLSHRNLWNTPFRNSVAWSVCSLVGLRPVERIFWKALTSSWPCIVFTQKRTWRYLYQSVSVYNPCCSDWDFEDWPNPLEIGHLFLERWLNCSCSVFARACEEYKHLADSTILGLVYVICCSFLSLWLLCKQHLNHPNLRVWLGSR